MQASPHARMALYWHRPFVCEIKGKIEDWDICNFPVALTRARQKVFLISSVPRMDCREGLDVADANPRAIEANWTSVDGKDTANA